MKKIINHSIIISCFAAVLFTACKKDYISGEPEKAVYANTSMYDVLADSSLFDTLVQVIDAAGIKDKINSSDITFFAPTDYSIYNYLVARTDFVQSTISDNAIFGLDSLLYYVKNNINHTKDSLLMYLIGEPLPYSELTTTGKFYKTGLGNKVIVSYEETFDTNLGYTSLLNPPKVEYFTHLWYPYDLSDDNPASNVGDDVGVHTLIKTSGIQTSNGILNLLESSHVLFFYGTKQ